ncbi:ninjurin-1 [Leptonychotes weddellii]|uniref:Ninjurin-1 n=1 Tax=Leptonychotes weddellii TaxID=9713 RepID=A0A7F8RDH5_LEPWE|nr:ninjurin-1 [Leptonychotes weddellii]
MAEATPGPRRSDRCPLVITRQRLRPEPPPPAHLEGGLKRRFLASPPDHLTRKLLGRFWFVELRARAQRSTPAPQRSAHGTRRGQPSSFASADLVLWEPRPLGGGLPAPRPWGGAAVPSWPSRWGRNRPINVNHYANKKSAAESMLDIALLMANASQLKAVIEQGPAFAFFVPLVVLISISLVLQIGVGVLLIFLVRYDLNNPAKHAKLDFLNNLATGLVFIIVVVNIFITAFGVQKPVMDVAPRQ